MVQFISIKLSIKNFGISNRKPYRDIISEASAVNLAPAIPGVECVGQAERTLNYKISDYSLMQSQFNTEAMLLVPRTTGWKQIPHFATFCLKQIA